MINPKYVGIAAGVGFIFTLLIGLFSKVAFPFFLLRSVISALVFGGIAIGISFLFQKFLSDATSSDIEASSSAKTTEPGGVVNITIDDEVLADEAQLPRFTVTNPQAMLGGKQTAILPTADESSFPAASATATADFTPVSLGSTVSTEAVTASAEATSAQAVATPVAAAVTPHAPTVEKGGLELDELPDIGDMSVPERKEEDVISDSDFASATSDEPEVREVHARTEVPAPTAENSALMAKAIQTVLAREN